MERVDAGAHAFRKDIMRPALFLDRDGVINVDLDYVHRIEDFVWQDGIFELARVATAKGFALVVVTNQSGIGRGFYTEDDFIALTRYMRARFAAEGAALLAVYHCPHHPQAVVPHLRAADHPWRKPRPGMILAARDEHDLDLPRSALVGDRWSDILAGHAAGVSALALVGEPGDAPEEPPPAERVATVADLSAWFGRVIAPT
jgi:D-glycero-D-manno-heptose 1,7-bisphosphate phosphatase